MFFSAYDLYVILSIIIS